MRWNDAARVLLLLLSLLLLLRPRPPVNDCWWSCRAHSVRFFQLSSLLPVHYFLWCRQINSFRKANDDAEWCVSVCASVWVWVAIWKCKQAAVLTQWMAPSPVMAEWFFEDGASSVLVFFKFSVPNCNKKETKSAWKTLNVRRVHCHTNVLIKQLKLINEKSLCRRLLKVGKWQYFLFSF